MARKVKWNKDMQTKTADGRNSLNWQADLANAMWELYWFTESQKVPTDLSPKDIEHCFAQLKEDACAWVRMATQKTAGQKGYAHSNDISFDNMARVGMSIIINCCHLAMHNVFGKLPEFIEVED